VIGWWDTALYCDPDAQTWKEAEQLAERELLAQSCVVRHARVEQTHREFWKRIDAKQRQAAPRLRLVRER
jgi:hypothetical protein